MMILRFLALAALASGLYVLIRRTGWSIGERRALILIAVATAVIVAAAVGLMVMQG